MGTPALAQPGRRVTNHRHQQQPARRRHESPLFCLLCPLLLNPPCQWPTGAEKFFGQLRQQWNQPRLLSPSAGGQAQAIHEDKLNVQMENLFGGEADGLAKVVLRFVNKESDKFIKDFQPEIAKQVSQLIKTFFNSALDNIPVS